MKLYRVEITAPAARQMRRLPKADKPESLTKLNYLRSIPYQPKLKNWLKTKARTASALAIIELSTKFTAMISLFLLLRSNIAVTFTGIYHSRLTNRVRIVSQSNLHIPKPQI